MQLSTLENRRNRLQTMCNGRFDVNKCSEQVIQLYNDIDKVSLVLICTAKVFCEDFSIIVTFYQSYRLFCRTGKSVRRHF